MRDALKMLRDEGPLTPMAGCTDLFVALNFGTLKDTRFLNLYGNTPTVIFGPGSTAVMHADDEYVSIDDYLTSIKVMALAIYDWCNAEPICPSA